MANNLSGNSTEIRMGITTRWTNSVLPRMGFADRKLIAQEIQTLTPLSPFGALDVLKREGILKPGFNGPLSEVQPGNVRRFSTETRLDSALGQIGAELSLNYTPATHQQLPNGLAGLSNRTRMLIGFQFTKQASVRHLEEGQQLVTMLNESDGELTTDICKSMTAIIDEIEPSLASIPSSEARDQLTGIIKTIKEKHAKVQNSPLDENDRAEIREVLSNIDSVVGDFRFQHEPHAPHLSLKVGSALSRFLTLGFMASILYLGTNTGYTNVDRAFYFTATASLALYAWGAANFTKIMSESESIRNLEFTQDHIAFRNLPREATKRFSNLGYKDGIASLIQDFYLDVVFGNHDLVLNNDSSNSYYQSTYGDSKEIWRIEKRAAIFERELMAANLQKNGQPLDDAGYRRLAAVMAMGERDIPSHFLLLEAAQRSGVHLGKVTCLLYKTGERGGEYASFNAARQIISNLAKTDPKVMTLVKDSRYLPSILDRMGAGFFLSGKFDETLLEMATAAGISPQTRNELQEALEKDKVDLYRKSLIQAAKDSGIDENRSQLFASTYLSMLTTAEDMKTIAEQTRETTYRSADADGEKLARSISREFGIDLKDAKRAVEVIKPTDARDLESEARNLNRDIAIPIGIRARMRDLVKAILFNERTDSERCHEEGNFHETAKALPNGSYLKDLIDSARQDFMAKQNNGDDRKGTMQERIFLSLKTRGIGDYTAKIIVDKVMDFAAVEYAKKFLSEEYERQVNASGHSRWWEVDHAMFKDYLGAIEDKIRETTANHRALGIEDIGPEKTTRVIAVISELFSLHQGIVNRTTDGYLATIGEDVIGIQQIAAALASSALPAIEKKAKEVKDDLDNKKKELARALYGDANPETLKKAEPVVKAINGLIRKGMGIERAQARFQDGNFLSFESLAAQIPDILFGDDKLHRTMLNKDSRYEAGTLQEDEIMVAGISKEAKKALKDTPEARIAIGNYVMAMSARFDVLEDIQNKLRQESRRLNPKDSRLKIIEELKEKIKAKEEEIKNTTDPAEKEKLENDIEKLLREQHSLESQIHHRRERVKETTIAPFADVVLEEMERDGTSEPLAVRVEAKRADIIMRMIERESKSYGLGAKPKENKPILDALKKLVEETIATNPGIPEDAPNTPVWRTFLYFERMNRDKYKGSKGANNDSSLGFYLGERIGVRLYTMLESMTSEESRVPPEILADIFRNFCDKVRLHPDFTEDQRIKEENGLFPEMIAKDLVRLIYEEKKPAAQAVAELASKWENAVLDIEEYQIEPLFAVASEIAVRAYGHEVLGFVAAKAEMTRIEEANKKAKEGAKEPPINRASLPDRAQKYYDLAIKYADVNALLDESYSNLSDDERATLKKEAGLLQKRLTANEKILANLKSWFARRSKIISEQEPNEDIRKKKIDALKEGGGMRLDRYALFHPQMDWYLIPAIDQPFAPGDRFKQFVGEGWQKRRREFIIPDRMTAEETAARMMTTSNNRMPMKKLENGFLRPYGLAFLTQARAIDKNIKSEYPNGIYGEDLEEVARKISKMKDEKGNYIAEHLDTDRFERPVEDERDVVRDLDADNFVFESSQAKANAYWQKRDGKLLRSYSALLQTQQAYPEMYSRLSSTQNYMGVLYSTTLGKSYGKRGKQVIMGCYIVKNRRAFAEATDWVEIPVLKRPEVEFVEESFSKDKTGDNPVNRQIKGYRYLKLLSKYVAAATLAGVGGALAFSGGGLMAVAAIGLTAGLTKFLLSENFENRFWRLIGYGMLAGSGALLATAIASGLWVAGLPLLAGVGIGLAVRVLDLWYHKSDSKAQRLFGKAIIPAAIGASLFINPIIAAGVFFGSYHFDDIKHLPYRFNIDFRQRVADRLGLTRESVIGQWWLMRQKLVRMYEEEEIYSQPDDVEDFGSSPAIFQRGYHSDFHQSIDGVSDDVKDKSTLDGQRGRWHGGMVGNLLRAIQAFFWDRQAMTDLDWMRYTLQTLGPAGSFSRFLLNINLWSFLGLGVTAFAFGTSPEALRNLLIGCSVISFLNYMTFASLLRRAMMTYGATWQKVSDMMAVLDSFSPVNLAQGITRVFYGETPPFLLTRSSTEPVSTATGNILAQTLPVRPFVNPTGKWEENIRKTIFSGEPLINTVVQTLRVRMAYALGAGAILLYTMPNLPYIGSGEILYSVMKGSLLFWSMLPILITTRSLSVIKEGASPYGTYKKIDKDAKGEPGKDVEKRRVKQLKKGLGKSAFNPKNKVSSSLLMAGTNPVLIAGAMAIAAGAGLHYLSEEHTAENYSAASTQATGDNLVIIPKIIPSATISSSAASASSRPAGSAEPLTPSVSTLSKALQARYETWKLSFMKNLDNGSTIVIDKSQNKSVSEGTGYGAMIAEKLADRDGFDRIQKGYDNLTRNRPDGLSSWEMDLSGNITKSDNAIDADIDNAAALLDAHKRWNDQTYQDKAQRIASATATHAFRTVNGKPYLMPSSDADKFVKGSDLILNPSYFDIEAFREFAKIDTAHANEWNAVVNSSYEVMEKCIEKWGFVPDWVGVNSRGEVFELTSEYRRSNNLFAETQRVHIMGNDAIRVLWNLAIDYKISHNERAAKIMKAILDKNPSPYNTKVADSNSQDSWHNEIATAAFALAAKVINHPNAAGYIAEFENYKRQGYYGSADDPGARSRYFNQTIAYLMDLEMPQK